MVVSPHPFDSSLFRVADKLLVSLLNSRTKSRYQLILLTIHCLFDGLPHPTYTLFSSHNSDPHNTCVLSFKQKYYGEEYIPASSTVLHHNYGEVLDR